MIKQKKKKTLYPNKNISLTFTHFQIKKFKKFHKKIEKQQ